jgi:hypothetical protein
VQFDVIWISEIKSVTDIHIPGYKQYRNTRRYENHGGIAMFIRMTVVDYVKSITFSGDDGIYVTFVNYPEIIFTAWYIPPSDTLYYREPCLLLYQGIYVKKIVKY